MTTHDIRAISVAEARHLRQSVLHPRQPPEALILAGDDHPQSFHAGAFLNDTLV